MMNVLEFCCKGNDGYMLMIVARLDGKMVQWSVKILEYVEVRTVSLNLIKEKGTGD